MNTQPKLQKPGAGLPWLETLIGKYWVVPYRSRKTSWESSVEKFEREGNQILSLMKPLYLDELEERILIPRIQGIEDSSRYWSVAMTVEHLIIVGSQTCQVIVDLSHGRTPIGKASVAKVKPSPQVNGQQTPGLFVDFLKRTVQKLTEETDNRLSKSVFIHPWFGALTSHQWNWILATHQAIHRRQIEKIIERLNKKPLQQ